MSSLTARALKWTAKKATGSVTTAAKDRARRARCTAKPNGRTCNKRLRTGRMADGMTCGSELCQLWFMAKDETATAHFLGMSTEELAERIEAARAA